MHSKRRDSKIEMPYLSMFVETCLGHAEDHVTRSADLFAAYEGFVTSLHPDGLPHDVQTLSASQATFYRQLQPMIGRVRPDWNVQPVRTNARGYKNVVLVRPARHPVAAQEHDDAEKCRVGQSDEGRGQGLFATKVIRPGEIICPFNGRSHPLSSLDALKRKNMAAGAPSAIVELVDKRVCVDPYFCEQQCGDILDPTQDYYCQHNYGHKANHSLKHANAKLVLKSLRGITATLALVATRAVPVGAEILWNYMDKTMPFYRT